MSKENWEKEFDEKFPWDFEDDVRGCDVQDMLAIKQFIAQKIQEARKDEREKIEKEERSVGNNLT